MSMHCGQCTYLRKGSLCVSELDHDQKTEKAYPSLFVHSLSNSTKTLPLKKEEKAKEGGKERKSTSRS